MQEQPFYIGQKVVCISEKGVFKKGETYTVELVDICAKCGVWQIGAVAHGYKDYVRNCGCGFKLPPSGFYTANASRFAPIQTERIKYVAVSESLREVVKENVLSINN